MWVALLFHLLTTLLPHYKFCALIMLESGRFLPVDYKINGGKSPITYVSSQEPGWA